MPGLAFSGPNLATVAYAEVDSTGSSTTTNSGIVTTRVSEGVYVAILPTNLAQVDASDLVFVQLKQSSDGTGLVPKNAIVDNSLSVTKTISVFSGNPALASVSHIDSSFSLLILRSTISPPAGAPY